VGGRQEPGGLVGIAQTCLEVDHRVERATLSDPVVDGPPRRLALLAVVLRAAERWERGAVNPEPAGVDAVDDFAVRGDESLCDGGRCPRLPRAADVVDTFEQNHPARPLQCQYITVQARQRGGAEAASQHGVSADPRVEDGDVTSPWV